MLNDKDEVGTCRLCGYQTAGVYGACLNCGAKDWLFSSTAEYWGTAEHVRDSGEGFGRGPEKTLFDSIDSEGRNSLAQHTGTSFDYSAHGAGEQGEDRSMEVCRMLINRLNLDGANWINLKDVSSDPASPDLDADCLASDGSAAFRIQVTRPPEEAFLASLNRNRSAVARADIEAVADMLQRAVGAKIMGRRAIPPSQRPRITLAINVFSLPSHAFPPAVRCFRARHGGWAESLCFNGIWVVGPSIKLTAQLDCIELYMDTW